MERKPIALEQYTDPLANLAGFINRACAFTGHRPQKLPWRTDKTAPGCVALKKLLTDQITELVEAGYTEYLSGMAIGVDTWASETVLALREKYPAIRLHCILPCVEQDAKWTASSRERYRSILKQANSIIYVNRENTKNCMLERNRFLVDHTSVVLAVYNGERRGGTAATVRYARKLDRERFIISPATLVVAHEKNKVDSH